ncbi:zf-HC2 domain-containing protein [Actinomycetospora sp. C-140]
MISGRGGSGWWSERFTEAGHLALDAVVAFVDDELPPGPAHRAAMHVDRCLSCAAEVAAQRQARRRVRAAGDPAAPSSLLSALCSIPDAAPLPGPPAGLAVDADGQFVVPADASDAPRAERRGRRRGRRRALAVPVAVSSGVVVGAAALAALTGPVVVAGTPAPAPPGSTARAERPLPTTAAAADLSVRSERGAAPGTALPGPGTP